MKNKFKKTSYIFDFTFLILFLISCTKPNPQNPFDPHVDISVNNLQYEKLAINKIKLTWENEIITNTGIIRIDKKIDNNTWQNGIAELASDATIWTDNNAEINQYLIYRISIIFNEHHSGYLETESINNIFPVPTQIQYFQLTISSIKMTWQDNCEGEDGFKIDKKVGATSWQIEFAIIGENVEEWVDTNSEINEDIQYRLYTYSGDDQSTSIETGVIDNAIPAPQSLIILSDYNDEITLNWEYIMPGIEGFKIARKVGSSSWNENYSTVDASILEWTDTGLDPETYYYKVYAYYLTFYSVYSNLVEETISDIPTEGLVAFYPFNGNANDESGNGYNGIVEGAILSDDRFGNENSAYSFDGDNDYINIEDEGALSFDVNNECFTLVIWFNVSQLYQGEQRIIIDRNSINNPPASYTLNVTNDGYLIGTCWDGASTNNGLPWSIDEPISIDTWYCFIETSDTFEQKFYLNNQLETANIINGINNTSNSEGTSIGRFAGGSYQQYFNGNIDDIRIYNRALLETEIDAIYHEGGWGE